MYWYTFLLILFCILLTGHKSMELYSRLQHLIDYVKNHTDAQQPDLMLGIYICEAQLLTINWNKHNGGAHSAELIGILDSIEHLREEYEHRTRELSMWESNSIVVQHLLNLSFWITSLQAHKDSQFFGNLTTNYPTVITIDNFAELIDSGTPSPNESDECLSELLNSVQCTISGRCLQIMSLTHKLSSHGYHLTHKLLYFMLMRYRNCGHCLPADELSLDYIIYTLCALIQHERNLIIEMDIPNALRDLFLEQTLLCGMSGYLSFIDEFIAKKIGQWQIADSGCFAYFDGTLSSGGDDGDDGSAKNGKFKRDANRLNGNCSDHMTGLAAAVYGLFAKITIHFYANVY